MLVFPLHPHDLVHSQLPPHHLLQHLHKLLQPLPVFLNTKRVDGLTVHVQHPDFDILFLPIRPFDPDHHRHDDLALGHPVAGDMARSLVHIRDDDGLAGEEGGGANADGAGGRRLERDGEAGRATMEGTEEELGGLS